MKTYSAKLADVKQDWWVIDAENVVLGRLASQVATLLKGKHKPMYTPNLDCGDHIVIVNAEKVKLTGNKKARQKTYYRHTGHPGGIKETTAQKLLDGRFPERVIELAVQRMIKREVMGRHQFSKLHVYKGSEHPHAAQQPKTLDIAAKNPKNKR